MEDTAFLILFHQALVKLPFYSRRKGGLEYFNYLPEFTQQHK
jgi:hypothetical protein